MAKPSIWKQIEAIRKFAAHQIATRKNWGQTEWYPFDDETNIRFELKTAPGAKEACYSATAHQEDEAGTVAWKPYILLI